MTKLHEIAKQIWLQSVQSVHLFDCVPRQEAFNNIDAFIHHQKIHNMKFTTQQINRETPEGKLLFAAIIELTTKIHTGKTPDEVISHLWDIHEKTVQANSECTSFKSTQSPFNAALGRSLAETNMAKEKVAKELGDSSNIILEYAVPSMNPDDYTTLEGLLVKLYRHHTNI